MKDSNRNASPKIKEDSKKENEHCIETENIPIKNSTFHTPSFSLNFPPENPLTVSRIDTYANAIPIGNISLGMGYFLFGMSQVNAYELDSIVATNLLFFGGAGTVTAGIFEYIKGRTFLASIYFMYGFFSLTHFGVVSMNTYGWVAKFDNKSMASYYFFWMLLCLGMFLCSFKSNVMFTVKNALFTIMFLLLCIGEGSESAKVIKAGGGFCIIASVVSFYIGLGHTINEGHRKNVIPMFPYGKENGIDMVKFE